MRIIGVDFSGAQSDRNTWMAEGVLEGNTLTIENCHRIRRAALTRKLAELSEPAVVGMDFPFSVPVEFANFWQQIDVLAAGWEMPQVWAAAAGMDWNTFRDLRAMLRLDRFNREPKRLCDPPESYSPLHYAPPNMVPMTFRGMQMLNRLWQRPEIRVPPLHPDPERDSVTLLEVMPGATLRSFGLPYTGYKNTPGITQEQREQRREMRRYILDELPQRINPLTVNLPGEVYDICLNNDDALDSVVAAITAALWATDRERFIIPPAPGQPNYNPARTLLEGWLYIPRRRCPACGGVL